MRVIALVTRALDVGAPLHETHLRYARMKDVSACTRECGGTIACDRSHARVLTGVTSTVARIFRCHLSEERSSLQDCAFVFSSFVSLRLECLEHLLFVHFCFI